MNQHINVAILVKKYGKVYRWKVVGRLGKVYGHGTAAGAADGVHFGRLIVDGLRNKRGHGALVPVQRVTRNVYRGNELVRIESRDEFASIGNAPKREDPHGDALRGLVTLKQHVALRQAHGLPVAEYQLRRVKGVAGKNYKRTV